MKSGNKTPVSSPCTPDQELLEIPLESPISQEMGRPPTGNTLLPMRPTSPATLHPFPFYLLAVEKLCTQAEGLVAVILLEKFLLPIIKYAWRCALGQCGQDFPGFLWHASNTQPSTQSTTCQLNCNKGSTPTL